MKTIKNSLSIALLALTSLSLMFGTIPAAHADAVGGPKYTITNVNAYTTDVFHVSFYSDEEARVALSGDGDTELDLYVYDANGNLIGSDTLGYGDDREVSWTPLWTGSFTIKVVNRGEVYNHYTLVTN